MSVARPLFAGLAVLFVVSAASAKPASVPSASPQRTTKPADVFYTPSKGGADTNAITQANATLRCDESPDSKWSYSVTVVGDKVFCKGTSVDTNTSKLRCPEGFVLTTEDKFPATLRAAFGNVDKCLKAGAPEDAASSYSKVACETDSTGGGFGQVPKNGADTCEKSFSRIQIRQLGPLSSAVKAASQTRVFSPVVSGQAQPQPTPQQYESVYFRCPTNATIVVERNAAYCKRK